MKVPQTFMTERDLEEKIKKLEENTPEQPSPEDVPEKINDLNDAARYLANSIIPVYGFDNKKRICRRDMTIKEALLKKIKLGIVDLLDKSPFEYKGVCFNQNLNTDIQDYFSLNLKVDLTDPDPKCKLTQEAVKELKSKVEVKRNINWRLQRVIENTTTFHGDYTTMKMDVPKEVLWVFETFKDFNPVVHGGALRDTYLGIGITGDIDVELTINGGWCEKKLYKLVRKVMEEVVVAKEGYKEDSYWGRDSEYRPAEYRARKFGILYDMGGGVAERYLSTEQIKMEKPGELKIHDLAKNDLDNRQFRFINSHDIPQRIKNKITKLENLGLTFLSEDPFDLSKKIENY